MLSPGAALARILASLADVAPLPAERVPLDAALGRTLGADLAAARDLPPFDVATMDGYALRAADAARPGARLPVAFELFAGGAPRSLPAGTCCRIFTGAPLPEGADAVEMQEEVRRSGRAAVFARPVAPGRFVRRRGTDVRAGDAPLRAGDVLGPGAIGLAAGLGYPEVPVVRRPRVGILPTGDELVPLGVAPGPGQIMESNGHALAAAAREAGADVVRLPAAGDQPDAIRGSLEAARGLDVLVTSGGVSVGTKDIVRRALAEAGARLDFWRVALRPGKPFTFGRWGRTVVFGLPGNPVSALVTFELFARPALRALAGLSGPGRHVTVGRLARAQEKPAGLTVYMRVRVRPGRDGLLLLEPLRSQASGDLTSALHDALAVLPASATRLRRGARVEVLLIR